MRPLKRLCKLNKEVTNDLCDEMGVEREQLFKILNREEFKRMVREAVEKEAKNFLGRRSFLEALALGAGITIGSMGLAKGDILITNDNIIVKDPSTGLDWNLRVPMPFSAIVGIEGRKVRCYDGRGKLIDGGVAGQDDARVIQSGVDSLTPNRSWKEKVVIKGTFTPETSILIPSYTIVDCSEAYFKLPSNADYSIFKNKNYGGFDRDIEILGGVFDGNNNTYSQAKALIDILGGNTVETHCQNIVIKKAKVINISGSGDNGVGIWLRRVSRSKVIGCWAENCKTGISVEGTHNYGSVIAFCVAIYNTVGICPGLSHNMIVEGNVVIYNSNNGIAVDSAHEIMLRNNYCASNGNHGIAIFTSISDAPEKATVVGNFVKDNSGRGISIAPSPYCIVESNYVDNNGAEGIYVGGNSRGAQIVGNKVMFSGYDGIKLYDAHNSVLVANTCLNNGQAGTGYSGIYLENYANSCVIVGNRCYDDQATKTQDYGVSVGGTCTYISIKNNVVRANRVKGIHITTTGIVYIKGNDGYPTESSDTTSLTGDGTSTTLSTTVAHGLVSDKFVARAIVYDDTVTNVVCIPVDADGDGFYESIKIVATFSSAPASGATIPVYWEAEVVS